jgi:hypothetical protein
MRGLRVAARAGGVGFHPFARYHTYALSVNLGGLMVTVPYIRSALMILTISGVALLGVIVFFCTRKDGLKLSHALVCALFGFYLAGTSIAPGIAAGGHTLASLLGGLRL